MTIKKQIEIAERIIETGLVTKVFHSVELMRDNANGQIVYPVYPRGSEYTYAGIDDAKGLFAYIRTNGDYTGVPLKIESCGRSYQMAAPLRIVFFNDNEARNHEELVRQLSVFTFLTGVTITRIVTDKFRLVREESPLFRAKFDGESFYVAFDILAAFVLSSNECEDKKCIVYQNPVTSCPAAVPTSTESATS